jgi:hypothetical protein
MARHSLTHGRRAHSLFAVLRSAFVALNSGPEFAEVEVKSSGLGLRSLAAIIDCGIVFSLIPEVAPSLASASSFVSIDSRGPI